VKLTSKTQPEYLKDKRVVYERDDLTLEVIQDSIRVGEEVVFQVTNTGDSRTVLGCHNPWAIQRHSNGAWQLIAWTSEKYYQMCATALSPGSTLEESIELSKSGLKEQAGTIQSELRSGQYRFLIIGTSPVLAIDFDVLDSE
jgi:hypothetical protein